MVRKTYAARGLLDFKMALTAGGALIRICFSGGSMGTNGVISAKYTTDNPALIHLIEMSHQYKSNRIYLYKTEKIEHSSEESGGTGETPGNQENSQPLENKGKRKGIIEL